MYTLYHGDCLDILPTLPAQSVDAIIADPPYGTTACKWDSVIPLDAMWRELKRVVKPRGAVVLFARQPFSSVLVSSCLDMFKYVWVWEKSKGANIASVNFQPLRVTEDILVFSHAASTYTKSANAMTYNPQVVPLDKPYTRRFAGTKIEHTRSITAPLRSTLPPENTYTYNHPRNLLKFTSVSRNTLHPTQKPVDLLRYLIRTYTNAGETVLDFCFGSCTTGVAALQEGRHFIGIEKEANYYELGTRRIEQVQPALVEAAD